MACRILVPQAGIESRAWQWKQQALTTQSPGNPPNLLFLELITGLQWFSPWVCIRSTLWRFKKYNSNSGNSEMGSDLGFQIKNKSKN